MHKQMYMSNDLEALIAFMDFYHEQLLMVPEETSSDTTRAEVYGSLKALDTIYDYIDDLKMLKKNINS